MDKKEYTNNYFSVNKAEHNNFGDYGYPYIEDEDTVYCIYRCTKNDKFYMTKQPRPLNPEGVYDLIGGTIKKGENPTIAMLRELQEEIGVELGSVNVEKIGMFNPNVCLFKDSKMHLYYIIGDAKPSSENQDLDTDERVDIISLEMLGELRDKCLDLKSYIAYNYILNKD